MAKTLKIQSFLKGKSIHWYTLFNEQECMTTIMDFMIRMTEKGIGNEKLSDEFTDMMQFIKETEQYSFGTDGLYLKGERNCHALPAKHRANGLGLRLYCFIVSNNIVILFNGDDKIKKNPEDCPNVSHHFNKAQDWAIQLKNEVKDKGLEITNLDEIKITY